MTPELRYALVHWIPYVVTIAIFIIGFAWTANQESRLRAITATGADALRQQCAFDSHLDVKAAVPDFCKAYRTSNQEAP